MKAYHFLPAKYALDDLKNKRLKISHFTDMNDPFELLAVECTDRELIKLFEATKQKIANEHGVICFSKNWNNPVLWSHYADKHKGICLGFDVDVPDNFVLPISYVGSGLECCNKGSVDRDFMLKLLSTKYKDWEYEDEVRIFADLKDRDPKTGKYFKEFDDSLTLREIILGVRFDGTLEDNVHIQTYANNVKLIHTTLELKSFRIIEDKAKGKANI